MTKRIQRSLIIFLVLGLSLSSCSGLFGPGKKEKIPFGYDPGFDYLSVLKSSPRYAYEPTDDLPLFTYQDSTDANLSELRTSYGLEDAAGDGDELSRIFNLLRWAHQSLEHDGGGSTEPENSLSILNYHEETGNGVNCVMMAIVLNEAYLAMGFPSRVVHGNARDWIFNGEWHTFNAVYARTLNNWVFVDPMNQAYFTDAVGTPLSLAEIREHLRQDLPLYLNEDADYNGQTVKVDTYLHYLSKNLFRFSTSLHSTFGNYWIFYLPEEATRSYVHLDPRNDPQDGLYGGSNYFTSNPDYYWIQP